MLKAFAGVLSLALAVPAAAETVHSLDQVPQHLKTPQAKEFFQEQIQGKPAPDVLGTRLPPFLAASAITALLVPHSDREQPNLVGAKPWPVAPDLYVAIVCTGGATPYSDNEPRCAQAPDDAPPQHVYLGLVTAKADAAPSLVAASGPIDCAMNWNATELPRRPMAADDAKDGIIRPDSFDSFDLARYRIAPDQVAFGVRGGWTEGYAGGGAYFTGLCLFARDGARLTQVLAAPMSAYSDVAGEWHKDHTRDHHITDAANVVIVSSRRTDGHFDLVVKNRAGAKRQVLRWSKEAGGYVPAANSRAH